MHDFFSPETQILFDDLLLLPQEGASTGPTGRPPNSFAILTERRSILFDAPYSWVIPAVRRLRDEGYPPAALVLSHSNVAGQGDAFDVMTDEFAVPVLLHPADAVVSESRRTGVECEDPRESEVLAGAGLEVFHFPGHTEGSILLYWENHGGVAFAGDSAVGPGPKQDPDPPRLVRAPAINAEADEGLRELWRTFDKPLRTVCPLHGAVYLDRDDMKEIMHPLFEGDSMGPMT
ncbi:hypothetical protein BH24ACT22_BH24ACT22_09570 [soil metagenome]